MLRCIEVRRLSNHIPDCSCGSHSCKSLLMKKHFRWETWYISGKRSKKPFSHSYIGCTSQSRPCLWCQGTGQNFPLQLAAAALSTSILSSSVKAPTKHLFEYPLLMIAIQQMLMVPRASALPLAPRFPLLFILWLERERKALTQALSWHLGDLVVQIPSDSTTAGGTGELCRGKTPG